MGFVSAGFLTILCTFGKAASFFSVVLGMPFDFLLVVENILFILQVVL